MCVCRDGVDIAAEASAFDDGRAPQPVSDVPKLLTGDEIWVAVAGIKSEKVHV